MGSSHYSDEELLNKRLGHAKLRIVHNINANIGIQQRLTTLNAVVEQHIIH
jgi:hypothetical protein